MSLPSEASADVPTRDAEELPSPGTVLAGKYRIDEVLGEGGMGVVCAARNLLTKRRVAIKVMLPHIASEEKWVSRFLREAQAAGRIHHPNIVGVYDIGREGKTLFLVMELLRGTPLTALMSGAPMAPGVVIELIMPALRGTAAAHAEGVIHRDLKPDNIFLCRDETGAIVEAKVLDFGISKVLDDDSVGSLTKTGTVMGTPNYMALEQIRGMSDVDRRVDVYAMGVILYEALTGHLPFQAASFPNLAIEVATSVPRSVRDHVPDLDPALDRIVMRAIARDRDARFPDIPSFARALEPFGNGSLFAKRASSIDLDGLPHADRATAATVDRVSMAATRPAEATKEVRPSVEAEPPEAGASIDAEVGDATVEPDLELPRSSKGLFAVVVLGLGLALALGAWLAFGPTPETAREVTPPRPAAPDHGDVTPPAQEVREHRAPDRGAAPPPSAEPLEPEQHADEVVPLGADLPPAADVSRAPERARGRQHTAPSPSRHRLQREEPATAPAPSPPAPSRGHAEGVRTGGVSVDEF